MTTPASTASRPRGTLALMFDAAFGPFFWGRLLATTGVWAYGLASALIAFEATSSTLTVGVVSAAQLSRNS